MSTLYTFVVVVHVLAAALWVGGMGLFALVVVPVAKRTLDEERARALLHGIGLRFASVGWYALGTLVVTGALNLHLRGLDAALATADFWRSPFGHTLAAKLGVVALVALASVAHARDARRGDRMRAAKLGRAILVLSVVVVVLAVMLVRGVGV
ncbi:MAG: DUF4149 domain-containing protein [Labilithrix sp.]|nr:DUF4149 domain-containing protein [Labilithrix sp.]MCW5812526.1 DUF4149 domain-containing protein [Labilithrix sp.]